MVAEAPPPAQNSDKAQGEGLHPRGDLRRRGWFWGRGQHIDPCLIYPWSSTISVPKTHPAFSVSMMHWVFRVLKDLNWQRLHVTSVDHALMIQREINIVLYVLDFKWSDWAYKMRKYEHDQLIVIACPTPIKASILSLWRVKFGELLHFYHNICFLL